MKQNLNILHLFLLLTTLIGPSCAPSSQTAPNPEERRWDAGAIICDTSIKLAHVFKIRNTGRSPLHITEITKSCTCTSASADKRAIDPGGEAALNVHVDTRPVLNSWVVNCRVVTDHPVQPNLDFFISYRTYLCIRFDESVVQFGDQVRSARDPKAVKAVTRQCAVELYEPVSSPTDSLSAVQGQRPITAAFQLQPDVQLLEGGKVRRSVYRVSATLAKDRIAASGIQVATLEARSQLNHIASITATWTDVLPIKITPARLSFGRVEDRRSPRVRDIMIRSYNDVPFRIAGFDDASEMLECREENGSTNASEHHVRIVLVAVKTEKRFVTGKLVIKTDYPGVPEVQLPWSVAIRQRIAKLFPPAHRLVFGVSNRQRIA